MNTTLIILSIAFAALTFVFLGTTFIAVKRKKIFGATLNMVTLLLMVSLTLLCAALSISLQGYNALTREELAAEVQIEPMGNQKFAASFTFADSSIARYIISGDEFYIDAHILKWHPVANIFGLHTLYQLDRVGGRYKKLFDEQSKERSIYSLSRNQYFDLFDLRKDYEFLSSFVDAEYGSGTFVNVKRVSKLNVMVSTTGLLIRKVN
ncbi:MAG: hypothetical protein PVH88_14950 [Ignavibacteria bacterium]|jgi:hypothetical protein